MAVHIGKEIHRVLDEVGIPVTTFAERINVDPATVHRNFRKASWDSDQITRACRVLRFNFFKLLSEDYEPTGGASTSGDPEVEYKRAKPGSPVRISFEFDPEDAQARKAVKDLGESLVQSRKRKGCGVK